jgi:hypothetical protein
MNKRKQRGVSAVEIVLAMTFLGVGVMAVGQMLGASGDASRRHIAKAEAVERNADLASELEAELSQSCGDDDKGRMQINEDGHGLVIQRVVGVAMKGGNMAAEWSAPIAITWNPTTRVVTRRVGDGPAVTVAKGVQNFAARRHPNGSGVIDLTFARKKGAGLVESLHKTRLQILPRNG